MSSRRVTAEAASPRRIGWATGLGLVLLATALGLGSAWLVLKRGDAFGAHAGPWRANLLAGSADADLYSRARVAVGGLLALNRAETMYYVAATDSDGQPLQSRCRYRVSGPPPKARWWSLTAYAEDYYLFPNEQRRYSVNGLNAAIDDKGGFALISGPTDPAWRACPGCPHPATVA